MPAKSHHARRPDAEIAARLDAIVVELAYIAQELRPPAKRPSVWARRSAVLREQVATLWEWLFCEPLPAFVRVSIIPHLSNDAAAQATVGAMFKGGAIEFDWSYWSKRNTLGELLATCVHEALHARGLRHGSQFKKHNAALCARLGVEPV